MVELVGTLENWVLLGMKSKYKKIALDLPNGTNATVTVQKFNAPPRLLNLKSAANYLGMGVWNLRQMVVKQEIPVVQHHHGARLYFDQKDLDKYVQAHKK